MFLKFSVFEILKGFDFLNAIKSPKRKHETIANTITTVNLVKKRLDSHQITPALILCQS